jgi:RNA polymerase subunit RPABC4/transcription elongation factor Spt4
VSVAPPGAAPAPGTIACPRCATVIGPDQDWCLACGAPARTRLVPTPNWRAPVAVLAVIVVLAGIALAIAFVSLTNDSEPAAPVDSQAPPPSATSTAPAAGAAAPTQPPPSTAVPQGEASTTAAPGTTTATTGTTSAP